MALSIKDEETYELVKELAKLKGASLTSTVKEAVREVLEKERAKSQERKPRTRGELLREFSEMAAPLFPKNKTANELINELYDDETGLPK